MWHSFKHWALSMNFNHERKGNLTGGEGSFQEWQRMSFVPTGASEKLINPIQKYNRLHLYSTA